MHVPFFQVKPSRRKTSNFAFLLELVQGGARGRAELLWSYSVAQRRRSRKAQRLEITVLYLVSSGGFGGEALDEGERNRLGSGGNTLGVKKKNPTFARDSACSR